MIFRKHNIRHLVRQRALFFQNDFATGFLLENASAAFRFSFTRFAAAAVPFVDLVYLLWRHGAGVFRLHAARWSYVKYVAVRAVGKVRSAVHTGTLFGRTVDFHYDLLVLSEYVVLLYVVYVANGFYRCRFGRSLIWNGTPGTDSWACYIKYSFQLVDYYVNYQIYFCVKYRCHKFVFYGVTVKDMKKQLYMFWSKFLGTIHWSKRICLMTFRFRATGQNPTFRKSCIISHIWKYTK